MRNRNELQQTKKAFTIRVSEEMVEMLDRFAEENHWSRNTAAQVIFEQQLKEIEEKEAVNG